MLATNKKYMKINTNNRISCKEEVTKKIVKGRKERKFIRDYTDSGERGFKERVVRLHKQNLKNLHNLFIIILMLVT